MENRLYSNCQVLKYEEFLRSHIIIYFENVSFLLRYYGSTFPHMQSLHTSLKIAHSGSSPSNSMSSLAHTPEVFLPLPPTFCPRHLHISASLHPTPYSHALDAQTISICLALLCQPHNEYSKGCKNPHGFLPLEDTTYPPISPSYALSSSDYADFWPSLSMFQSHVRRQLIFSPPITKLKLENWTIS